jgi:hypothetical protein
MTAYRYRERRYMSGALKDLRDTKGPKETSIEGVLKELQGKSLTKKKLFEFLADINIKDLYKASENAPCVEEVTEISKGRRVEEFKCGACMKTFATKASLQRHQDRFTVCKEWIELPQKTDPTKLTKGIHLIINELLERSIGDGELECKYCKTKFMNKGNHHKHFNTSTVCNRMAYQEFKRLFSEF